MKKIRLITDGSCLGNPGPGGWACTLRFNKHKREMYGCAPHTTNNRMELTAAIEGLGVLKETCMDPRLAAKHHVKWSWTKGHASHDDNSRCDELAQLAARGQCASA